MSNWERLQSVVNDPNYFHGGPGNVNQCFGLYNVTFDRFIIVGTTFYDIIQIKKYHQYTMPTVIYNITENIDNSCCGAWTIVTPNNILHSNRHGLTRAFDSELINVGPVESNINDYLEIQKNFLDTHSKITYVPLYKS